MVRNQLQHMTLLCFGKDWGFKFHRVSLVLPITVTEEFLTNWHCQVPEEFN